MYERKKLVLVVIQEMVGLKTGNGWSCGPDLAGLTDRKWLAQRTGSGWPNGPEVAVLTDRKWLA